MLLLNASLLYTSMLHYSTLQCFITLHFNASLLYTSMLHYSTLQCFITLHFNASLLYTSRGTIKINFVKIDNFCSLKGKKTFRGGGKEIIELEFSLATYVCTIFTPSPPPQKSDHAIKGMIMLIIKHTNKLHTYYYYTF